jgi:hypothetical protein
MMDGDVRQAEGPLGGLSAVVAAATRRAVATRGWGLHRPAAYLGRLRSMRRQV